MKYATHIFFKILILGIFISAVISGWAWGFEALNGREFVFDDEFGKEVLGYLVYGVVLTTVNMLFLSTLIILIGILLDGQKSEFL